MRWAYVALFISGCAANDKMAWPEHAYLPTLMQPAAPPSLASPHPGQGGPLSTETPLPVTVLTPHHEPSAILFEWPVAARGINSLFGYRKDPMDGARRFHAGVDLDASYGEVIRAAAPGTVAWASWYKGHGRQVVIEHVGGFRSSYSHLAQTLVQEGDQVRQGQPIGQLGSSGRSTGPHLHFEISRHGAPLDPLDILGQVFSAD